MHGPSHCCASAARATGPDPVTGAAGCGQRVPEAPPHKGEGGEGRVGGRGGTETPVRRPEVCVLRPHQTVAENAVPECASPAPRRGEAWGGFPSVGASVGAACSSSFSFGFSL